MIGPAKPGTKLLAWLGVIVTVAGTVADLVEPGGRIAEIAGHIAMFGGTILAALGGSIARPRNQRASDPEG